METKTIKIKTAKGRNEIGRNEIYENYMLLDWFASRHYAKLREGCFRLQACGGPCSVTGDSVEKIKINKTEIFSNPHYIGQFGGWNPRKHNTAELTDENIEAGVADLQALIDASEKEIKSKIKIKILGDLEIRNRRKRATGSLWMPITGPGKCARDKFVQHEGGFKIFGKNESKQTTYVIHGNTIYSCTKRDGRRYYKTAGNIGERKIEAKISWREIDEIGEIAEHDTESW